MKITDFLSAERIIPALQSEEKEAALKEMAERLAACEPGLDAEQVLRVLRERERISTTAIGEGVAIPHGKLPGVERVVGIFARSLRGIDFASLDGRPTHLFFVLIAPEHAAADHLKALARISRLLKDTAFRERLLRANNGKEIFAMIAEEDQKF
ncbi:MAG TPA: PTS sugar transporter subunit IIA [candidate division Zixibacteria bacterium]|nr:PTS sugar transporter subunit IIA [candidate division Zixibacteria bacterium]